MGSTEPERIRAEYLARLRRALRRLPADVREDAVAEVASHIEDEWQALGGDEPAMRDALERLGTPEGYGRDLALQLILLPSGGRASPARVVLAGLFWASTSLVGAAAVLCAALVLALGLGMVFVAVARLSGSDMMLIDARSYQFMSYRATQLRFPPAGWPPLAVALAGIVPALAFFAGLYRFFRGWLRSRLAQRALLPEQRQATVSNVPSPAAGQEVEPLPRGWERRAALATTAIALLSVIGCMLFTILGEMVSLGRGASLSLPADFFRTPLTFLAFLATLAFLGSPVLGLLWAVRRR